MRAVLVLLLVAGCATQTEPVVTLGSPLPAVGAPAAAVTASAAPLPQAQASVVALSPPAEPEPELSATGDDHLAVLQSLEDYRSWLFRHPDPDGLAAILDLRCACLAADEELLTEYARQGRWWTGAPPRIVDVEVLDATDPDIVTLRATSARDGTSRLVDATGAVHEIRSSQGEWLTDYVLVREGPTAPWRVRDVVLQGSGEP